MPSLFSRSRTHSTPQKSNHIITDSASPASLDEFGRVSSRSSNRPFAITVTTPSKKDKKKAKDLAKRSKTLGARGDNNQLDQDQPPPLPDGSFLPLNLEPPNKHDPSTSSSSPSIPSAATAASEQHSRETDYGYLSYQRHVVLGLEQVNVLVNVVADELETRGGITTPFIFSTTALDISAAAIKRLIRSFLNMCSAQGTSMGFADAERAWKEEARYVGPHELGMCLRWGLARLVRVSGGQDVRGLISWEHYVQFRDSEAALGYPPSHFETILHDLDPTLQSIIVRLLFLLTRLTANSTSSGHTPPTLSPLFGPLLFGLGPATLAFHHAYIHYLRAVNATEHLILAFIRWQDTPRLAVSLSNTNSGSSQQQQQQQQQQQPSGSAAALGVPIRLKEWIKGYPAMLPFLHDSSTNHSKNLNKPQPRKGAKTLTLTTVRRNVRMYSPDLVRTASTWAHRTKSYSSFSSSSSSSHNHHNYYNGGVLNGLANSKEWDRIAPATLKLPPRYSENYRKRMGMPHGFNPEIAPGMAYSQSGSGSGSGSGRGTGSGSGSGNRSGGTGFNDNPNASSSLASTLTIGTLSRDTSAAAAAAAAASADKDYFGLGKRESEGRFRSLTDLKWGEFENMGFGSIGDDDDSKKKLQFDLTESAREERAAKRQTLSWNDFSTTGFSRMDAPLNATLQFSAPLAISVSNWPARDAELTKKIKKTEKQLPPFGWDTEPVMGNEEIIEEAFVDVFCDLIYGGGWMDLERSEGLDRDVNWALVEFKSLPPNRTTVAGGSDPRTATSLILFEEFVPLEYRQQLAVKSTTRRRLPALFSPSKKQWKQAATLNGRPYVVGHVPRSPSYREMEFEGLLQGGSGTKVISLGSKASTRVVSTISTLPPSSDVSRSPPPPVPPLPSQPSSSLVPPFVTPTKQPPPPSSAAASALSPITIPRLAPNPPKSDASHSDSTVSPSVNKKSSSSRFKITNVIPVPSPKRLSMVPAEYSVVDFDTRLASYSDSERNNSGGDYDSKDLKKKRRESKDDAWVDILVNSASRRMPGQDVDPNVLKTPERGAGGDPDMASLEVAQVLAAVRRDRQISPSLGSLSSGADDGDFVPHSQPGLGVDMDAHVQRLEIDEIERVPRRVSVDSGGRAYEGDEEEEDEGDDEEGDDYEDRSQDQDSNSHAQPERGQQEEPQSEVLLSVRHALKQQRRLGYFDMHPERKKLYDAEAAEGEQEDGPSPDLSVEKKAEVESTAGPAQADPATLPQSAQANGNGHTVSPPAANGSAGATQSSVHPIGPRAPGGAPAGTKTAALIEMYRERERRAGTSPAPTVAATTTTTTPPSVPVSAPVPVPAVPIVAPLRPQRSAGAVLPGATNVNASIDVAAKEPVVPVVITPADAATAAAAHNEPPRVVLEETGRASPARYVHGAPLHNVLEEEEEE